MLPTWISYRLGEALYTASEASRTDKPAAGGPLIDGPTQPSDASVHGDGFVASHHTELDCTPSFAFSPATFRGWRQAFSVWLAVPALRGAHNGTGWQKVGRAVAVGCAICSMHGTGVAAKCGFDVSTGGSFSPTSLMVGELSAPKRRLSHQR